MLDRANREHGESGRRLGGEEVVVAAEDERYAPCQTALPRRSLRGGSRPQSDKQFGPSRLSSWRFRPSSTKDLGHDGMDLAAARTPWRLAA